MKQGFMILFEGGTLAPTIIRHALGFLDRLVVVEGAVQWLDGLSPRGHSLDGTLAALAGLEQEFQDKLIVLHRTGCWRDKTEMCNAALPFLEPGYLWQIDGDEAYHHHDMQSVENYLKAHQDVTDVEFCTYTFYGDLQHRMRLRTDCLGNRGTFRRVFRYDGRRWTTHAPPRLQRWVPDRVLSRYATAKAGIFLYHYGYCFRRQVALKSIRERQTYAGCMQEFDEFRDSGSHPMVVPFVGTHPFDIDQVL